jgi:CRP/FNR family transcriptional regulator, cyclic AMP receptor protein
LISLERLHQIADWARHLPPEELERARRGIVERRFARGTFVCHRGDRFDYWAGVVTGLLRLGSVSSAGKEVTFAGLPPRGWFGEGSMLKDEPRQYDLYALQDTELALMNKATFHWLAEHSVAFNRYLVRQLNERLGQFIALVEHDRMHGPEGRLARNLAQLFNPVLNPPDPTESGPPHLKISQEDLGQLSGLSRPVANRALNALEAEGLIRLERGGVAILDLDGLRLYGERG